MIKLLDLVEEMKCWPGYKKGSPKTKISSRTGERVNNCVPVEEGEIDTSNWGKETADDGTSEEDFKFKPDLADFDFDEEKYREYMAQHFPNGKLDLDEVEEYDVVNEQDLREFIEFMESYQQELNEATCDCMLEAKYQGRTVPLGKPMRGDSKKFKVYVKNPKTGKVVKVNFGAKGMNIKKNNPKRRAAFRARHNCKNPGPRTKARYWSCRKW